ncbi:hypothetical protein [Kribbella lupini]|uniref:Tetratricopeptide repeat protein n=1 Tax=Kribbella lupini TaxID=291602 RepID=A0ABP4MEJ6_9ACTN
MNPRPGFAQPPLSDFTGRAESVDELLDLVRNPERAAPEIVLSAIGGMGRVGRADEAHEAWRRAAMLYDREADARAAGVRRLLAESPPDRGRAGQGR